MNDNWSDKGAICPHCEYLNEAANENWELYKEDVENFTCNECNEDFEVEAFVRYSWTTKKADDE